MLLDRLGVKRLAFAIGGSLGGMLALEFASLYGGEGYVAACVAIACCARHTCVRPFVVTSVAHTDFTRSMYSRLCLCSDWAIGMGEVERQAIFADARWCDGYYELHESPMAGAGARHCPLLRIRL
jgi:homoserine O-acetyltransferase